MPFTAGRSSSQLPALKLDWNQNQQPLRQGCHPALWGRSLPVNLAQLGFVDCAVWQTVLLLTTTLLPQEAGSWGAAPLISHSREAGGNTKERCCYLPLSGWDGPSCENCSSSSEHGTIPKQIQQKVPPSPAGLSVDPSCQEPLLASHSPCVEGRGAARRDGSVGKGL